jgi:glycosyltransferase involved in cell wall biosynthesis
MDDVLLPAPIPERLREIGPIDILVGIPSFNNARTIGHVVRAVQAGFAKYFPAERTLLLNSDGGSTDDTQEVVRTTSLSDFGTLLAAHPVHGVHRIVTPYHGIPGKGSALRTVFAVAAAVGAKACAVVDADLRSITPEWFDLLISPVYRHGFDFVAPLYHRHKYDGTITNSIVYPLTRALYGKRVRQPIGGDFGFSGALAANYLKHDVWHSDVARFGIDIWMTTTAITGGYRVCQSFLGAKIHDVKDPGVDLSAMLTQVVSAVFSLMESHQPIWKTVNGTESVPLFGFEHTVGLEPVNVDVDRMVSIFRSGTRDLAAIWERILAPETFALIQGLGRAENQPFRFPPGLWVQVVYDFATAYNNPAMNREHLLRSLTPLYLGRTASFVNETKDADASQVEDVIEGLCLEYETKKPYLVERWSD